ncbi:MAG: HD domain-containing protein [Planctomycetes bacterium]|nr:HD domain-containing protein [Planctomycetota bacterium]
MAGGFLKPIDTAFAILFLLLVAMALLHVTAVTDLGGEDATKVLAIGPELERLRALEQQLCSIKGHLEFESMDRDIKVSLLSSELEHIENRLKDLGSSTPKVLGLTPLVGSYNHIRDARARILAGEEALDGLLAAEGLLDRALQATLFVTRNNITRLADELARAMAARNLATGRNRNIGLLAAAGAILVFAPVRLMAKRAASKPIQALKAATRAVAEERWSSSTPEHRTDDSVGELQVAFDEMAHKLETARKERADAFRRTLASLVQAIEAKDGFTSNHSWNVAKFAELLSRAYGLSDAEIKDIARGALLHDVGKIGIPDAIINKTGKLTPEEFSVIQEHPVIGARIVAPLDGSEVLLDPVRHHHEHWDGKGYPDQLSGEDIPLSARLIAVADVFEALISDRPYRKKMSLERAVEILEEEAGKTLDPELVELFCSKVLPETKHLLPGPPREFQVNDFLALQETLDEEIFAVTAR